MEWIALGMLAGLVLAAGFVYWQIRRKNMQRWLVPYLFQSLKRRRLPREVHLLLCIADHYEPKAGRATREQGAARVRHWLTKYPELFARFKDSDGRPPRHSFFFPMEEYEPEYLHDLAELCRQGFGEVEIHLHHDKDTPEALRRRLADFRDLLVERHGLLSRNKETGEPGYAFIHGNWALCNSRADGTCCGVNNELDILRATGCYVDMTFPSAPVSNQPPKVNSIYYAWDKPGQSRSHETGQDMGSGPRPANSLLLINGPLVLDWHRRKWGLLPRLENGCLQHSQPPSLHRIGNWLRANVHVPLRPEWIFVKLHAHGAPEEAHDTLLGEPMVRLHEELARRAREDVHFHFHYVTAREMYNLAKAAEAGFRGSVAEGRDFVLLSNLSIPDKMKSQAAQAVSHISRT